MKTFLKKIASMLILMAILQNTNAQNIFPSTGSAGVGTVTPVASALFEMKSTSQGMLIPRMTKVQRDGIASPEKGLIIYQINSTPGFYYYDGGAWTKLSTAAAGANKALSNLSAPTAINADLLPGGTRNLGDSDHYWHNLYVGNNIYTYGGKIIDKSFGGPVFSCFDNNSFIGLNAGVNTIYDYYRPNTFIGASAGYTNTYGYNNAALGSSTLFSNISGHANTAIGSGALYSNTTASDNIAVGFSSLYYNTTGFSNTALGILALNHNISGYENIAVGENTLFENTTGNYNVAMGRIALWHNKTGNSNVALGSYALQSAQANSYNIAIGDSSLYTYNDGSFADYQVAVGFRAMKNTTTGYFNTSIGGYSLFNNTTGYANTALGTYGLQTNTTGYANTALGYQADVTTSGLFNTTSLGYNAKATVSNQIMLGNSAVVIVRTYGTIIVPSDGRFKKNIKENVPGLDFINALRPVTYNYNIHGLNKLMGIKEETDTRAKNGMEQAINTKEKKIYTGFIAQEVEKTADKLGYDFSGIYKPQNEKDPYGLSYSDFVVPLVKAVQQLSKLNDNKDAKINDLEARLAKLETLLSASKSSANVDQSISLTNTTLEQNIPNPFSNATVINYTLPQKFSNAQIIITDYNGKILKQIAVSGTGKGNVTIDAATLAAGTYQYSLITDGKMVGTKQMIHIK